MVFGKIPSGNWHLATIISTPWRLATAVAAQSTPGDAFVSTAVRPLFHQSPRNLSLKLRRREAG